METRNLGSSGLEASVLGLGTSAMGGVVTNDGAVDDNESIAAIHEAIDCGITLIDTAPIHGLGHSEEIVGKAVADRRDRVLIMTKCGLLFPSRTGMPLQHGLSRTSIAAECEASLRRLRCEVIDVYCCHLPDPDVPISETMEAMTVLLDQGKIRAIGLATLSCEQVSAAREFGPIHCVHSPFSILNRRAADDLIPYCQEYGIGVVARGALERGILTGRFDKDSVFGGLRANDPAFLGRQYRRNLEIADELARLAAARDRTLAQLALGWVASFPGVASAIVGARRASQVRENAGGVGWSLVDADRRQIDDILGGAGVGP